MKFLWIKDSVIQIIFISVAIVFTVIIAHMAITELYTDYYIQQMHGTGEALSRNVELLHGAIGDFLFETTLYDDTRFMEFSQELTNSLYVSLIRGILIMALGFLFFTAVLNLRKKTSELEDTNEEDVEPANPDNSPPRLIIQILSMVGCGVLAWGLLTFQGNFAGVVQVLFILFGGLFLGLALAHLVRILLWVVGRRTGTSYSAQTTQFCVFLMIFLTMFSLSMHNGFNAHVESSNLEELRIHSFFTALSLAFTGEMTIFEIGEHDELYIMNRSSGEEDFFTIYCEETATQWQGWPYVVELLDTDAHDLFAMAWDEQASVMGIRGDYKYGVTAIIDRESREVTALTVVRRPTAILTGQLRLATIDFMLAVSATVFALVFLFIEMNKLLESINLPNLKREREWKYAAGAKSLNFLVIICQAIPAYFFVLIVLNIYEHNPVDWLPSEFALILPLAVVLLMMVAGGELAARIIKILPRNLSILGCIMGAGGFLAMGFTDNLFVWLGLLAVSYLGVAIVYLGVQQFISNAAGTGYKEFRTLGEETLSGEYLGGTSGAVLGAIVFDWFGLFWAFALSAAIMLLLAILIRFMLPVGQREVLEKSEFGLFRFLFSKRILMFVGFLMAPFVVGEFFIMQFAPLYADSINLSAGAASWTYLLMTMAAAFAAPFVARAFLGRLRKITICVFANLLSASGLVMFSLIPGIVTMYIASALLGFSIGTGTNMVEGGYGDLDEAKKYKRSNFAFKMFGVVFGQMGVALFTIAHSLSPDGEYVLIVAGVIALPTLIYYLITRKEREGTS
ncbi:MAG: MFS transporter [Defluviitaleaceae bacterium]|nr:MFS transporter [Defluviitaleaceae bacterium]